MGLEPIRLPTRPSNVRVCLFRHSRVNVYYYTHKIKFVNTFFDFILYNIFVCFFARLYRIKEETHFKKSALRIRIKARN